MKHLLTALIIVISMLGLISCENTNNPLSTNSTELNDDGSLAKRGGNGSQPACSATGISVGYTDGNGGSYAISEYTLWAGQHNNAGTVTISNDDENIYVSYNTNATAILDEVHVSVWTDLDDVPRRRPAPGHADYTADDIDADSYTVIIPADLTCGDTYYISAHAALESSHDSDDNSDDDSDDDSGDDSDDDDCDHDNGGETAYAGDVNSPACFDSNHGAWWGYVNFTVDCYFDITGTVYDDVNNNASNDSEAGIAEVLVNLINDSNVTIASSTSDASGNYFFTTVPGGQAYSIAVEVGPSGATATQNATAYSISNLSTNIAGVNFGFYTPVAYYTISGTVYNDVNGDGDLTGRERGIRDPVLNLLDESGLVIATSMGDGKGNYTFSAVASPGTFSIVVQNPPAGSLATENGNEYTFSNLDSDLSDIDFGFFPASPE